MKVLKTIWRENTGIATCIIVDRGRKFYGMAICSDEDSDFMNQYTGI